MENNTAFEGDEGEEKGSKKMKVKREATCEKPNLHNVRSRAAGVPFTR